MFDDGEGVEHGAVDSVPGFPLRRGKIERPKLPADTLRRDRLLEWIESNIERRAIFVVAEAGFGKTTLLADFARRRRLRTIWYHLDEDDTDALAFLRYLVAACQAEDPALARDAATLLTEGAGPPASWERVLEAFVAGLAEHATERTIIVLDDYHTVESVGPIREAVERLLARAPELVTFVFASRRTPNLAVARLRTHDGLAELDGEDLRFEPGETERLFRDAYRRPLEPDVLADLQTRTDGWAASLQLVRTAVEDRSSEQIRTFVRSLSGAEGELYDYLAEEVVGDLPDTLQRFLMRAALLDEIEPEIAAVAADVSVAEARRLLVAAGRLGLVSRGSRRASPARFHPLVTEFLLARLEADLGEAGMLALHREIARQVEPRSWRLAARHWAAAGEAAEVRRVVVAATPTILGTGDYAAAQDFIKRFPDPDPNPWFDIILSRIAAIDGLFDHASRLADRAITTAQATGQREAAELAALAAVYVAWLSGNVASGERLLRTLVELKPKGEIAQIAVALTTMQNALAVGTLEACRDPIMAVAETSRILGHDRNQGIAYLNLSYVDFALDRPEDGLDAARRSASVLDQTGSADESAAAHVGVATGLARIGRWEEARAELDQALRREGGWVDSEIVAEVAELHAMYGSRLDAERIFASLPRVGRSTWGVRLQAESRLCMMRGDYSGGLASLETIRPPYPLVVAFTTTVHVLRLQIAVLSGDPMVGVLARQAIASAEQQGAWFLWKSARIAAACAGEPTDADALIRSLPPKDRICLSVNAELVVRGLHRLGAAALAIVYDEAESRRDRWLTPLRDFLTLSADSDAQLAAAHLLEVIGEPSDVRSLRTLAAKWPAKHAARSLGRSLIRRSASPVHVEDLGLVAVRVGDVLTVGTEIRRRVLSLLCYLLTRPQFAATRDQVLEAIWPDQDPTTAANSLNQTAYFLRRVFEPDYADSRTAGYLRHENEVLWLDRELVDCRSAECQRLLTRIGKNSSVDEVLQLTDKYVGRFALDFMYDEWARDYRESLHAAFLGAVEHAVSRATQEGEFDDAITVAQRAIAVDPEAEQVELALLRLYRATGAHSAAAEQYSHYAAMMREQLGVDPPPLELL